MTLMQNRFHQSLNGLDMDAVIEELRRKAEPTPVGLDLPSEDDLVDVEEHLFLTLPAEYREFLLTVSDVVLGSIEPATAADPQLHTYLPELAAEAWLAGLPRHLIPICQIKTGYYSIDEDGRIGLWDKGTFSEQEWETIWDWACDVWLGYSV